MPSSPPDDTVRLFLSYAREDFEVVSALYDRLEAIGMHPWMDKFDILPGERWETKLSQAIRESHFFVACLSAKSVEKRGYLQREFKQALDLWQEKLADDIYLIPVRLDECQVPETLRAFQWANLYEEDAWWALLRAIRAGAERQGLMIPQGLRDIQKRVQPVQLTHTNRLAIGRTRKFHRTRRSTRLSTSRGMTQWRFVNGWQRHLEVSFALQKRPNGRRPPAESRVHCIRGEIGFLTPNCRTSLAARLVIRRR